MRHGIPETLCWHGLCLFLFKEVTMIQIAQIKRMMQLILIILCTLFLVSNIARAQDSSKITKQMGYEIPAGGHTRR